MNNLERRQIFNEAVKKAMEINDRDRQCLHHTVSQDYTNKYKVMNGGASPIDYLRGNKKRTHIKYDHFNDNQHIYDQILALASQRALAPRLAPRNLRNSGAGNTIGDARFGGGNTIGDARFGGYLPSQAYNAVHQYDWVYDAIKQLTRLLSGKSIVGGNIGNISSEERARNARISAERERKQRADIAEAMKLGRNQPSAIELAMKREQERRANLNKP
jgi:hypothetical protein